MAAIELSDSRYIAAIYDGSLCAIAPPSSKAQRACARINNLVSNSAEELTGILAAANIGARRIGKSTHYNQFDLEVEPDQANEAMEILRQHGYQQWAPLQGGALRCYMEHYHSMMFIRDAETTMRAQLCWGKTRRVARIFRPTIKSLASVRLPEFAWPTYYLLRPLHLITTRLRGTYHSPEPRPFLGTPESLLLPLFELARIGPDDVFVDLGCGDGRVAIEAARRYGCRSIGIEYHSDIADRACARVRESGWERKVSIIQADVTNVDLDTATVMFAFLPMASFKGLLPKILKQVKPGARIISHELNPIEPDFEPKPKLSLPVFGADAITVAHIWIA